MFFFSGHSVFLTLTLLSTFLLSGCGSMRSYDRELTQTINKATGGQCDQALIELEKNNQSEEKDLLYFFEKGQLLNIMGECEQSRITWLLADEKVRIWEEDVKADPEKFLGDVGSILVNDKTRRYDGHDFEKVMLSSKLAINHIQLGDFDSARIEIKKTHEREAIIAELREKEQEKVENASKEKKVATELKDLKGYPVETLNDPEVTALKNSYQSAFSHYLAGFIYEALGEPSLAAPGYRTAIELRPDLKWLEDGLANLESRQKSIKRNETDIVFVIETGTIPARQSINFPIPIFSKKGLKAVPISFPVIRPERATFLPTQLLLDGQTPLEIVPVTNLSAMAIRALKDDMPGILLRGTLRAIAKTAAQKATEDTHIVLQLAVTIGSVITESADERGWRTLPSHILLGRTTLPAGKHSITITTPTGPQTTSIDIAGKHALIPLRIMGNALYLKQPIVSPQMLAAAAAIEEPPPPPPPEEKKEKKPRVAKNKKKTS